VICSVLSLVATCGETGSIPVGATMLLYTYVNPNHTLLTPCAIFLRFLRCEYGLLTRYKVDLNCGKPTIRGNA
jgi:hypothetical protein